MPKLRRTPRYFQPVPRAKGRVTYKWEPSATLRRMGWATVMLGDNYVAAIAKAEALNAELDAWRVGASGHEAEAKPIAPANRFHARWSDLDRAYRADEKNGLLARKPKTQKEYDSRLKWLSKWAENGNTRLSDITREVAEDLRDSLVDHSSAYKAAAIMRVFSLLMGYAEKKAKMLRRGSDPSKELVVPTPPRRRKSVALEIVEFLAATARNHDLERVALALELGFYTLQRPGDLRTATAMHWRRMNDLDASDRAALCGPDGLVYGLRFQQAKTGAWIGNAVHHDLRLKVEARLAAMHNADAAYILFHDGAGQGAGKLWHEREFNRDFRNVVNFAIEAARASGDNWLTDELTGLQFRDIRRSGMGWHKDMGASKEQIASRSGHNISEVEDILKTYMPANERGSAAAFARAIIASQDRKQERNEA